MIPYEELVSALAHWRARQGLPPLHSDYLGAPKKHRIDASSALAAKPARPGSSARATSPARPPIPSVQAAQLQETPENLGWDEPLDALDSIDETGAYGAVAEQARSYGGPSYDSNDSIDAPYDPSAYGDDLGGDLEEPTHFVRALSPSDQAEEPEESTHMVITPEAASRARSQPPLPPQATRAQSAVSQPFPGYMDADADDESTHIGAMLGPGANQFPAGQGYRPPAQNAMEHTHAFDVGGVPSEPVYDSLAAAAEYRAEQEDYAAQAQGYTDMSTEAHTQIPASDMGHPAYGDYPYDPASTNAYQPGYGQPGYGYMDDGEPPPLEPPPLESEDDFMVTFDEKENQPK